MAHLTPWRLFRIFLCRIYWLLETFYAPSEDLKVACLGFRMVRRHFKK